MTAYIRLRETVGVDPPHGGVIRSASDDIYIPQQLGCTPTGAALGPVYLGVPNSGGVCSVERLDYLPGSDEGGILAVSLAVAGTGEGLRRSDTALSDTPGWIADRPTSRRGVLQLLGALIAVALYTTEGTAQSGGDEEETVTLQMAEIDITGLSDPLSVRVIDVVDEVLPPTTEILIDADDTRVGEIREPGEGAVLPADTEGTIYVYLRDARSRLAALLAWVSGMFETDDELVFKRELPKEASKYSNDEFIRLSEHPAIVDPIVDSDPDEIILSVGNTQIPNADAEGSSEAGQWTTIDGALVYEVGENPPASSSWEVRIGVSMFDQLTN